MLRGLTLSLTLKEEEELPDHGQLTDLDTEYLVHFQGSKELDDVGNVIGFIPALVLTLQDHHHLPSRLTNLGSSYGARFQRPGQLDDIEVAIKRASCALVLSGRIPESM
ncbi:unnamed protein product [Rhizoctonia solani]|uniref:Uncharacterized protein n=1 Tax=Rhizoctonia solani TaxID=456999 RepID=A0A8H2ZZR2_9AGAM|nr:unnamed protein product [Rhizoctonia solani]